MFPFLLPFNKTMQNICRKIRPYLPTHRILVAADKVDNLKSLFDLLEKNRYGPAYLIEIANKMCRPNEVVGDEGHSFKLSVDINDCPNQMQGFRVPDESALSGQFANDISKNIELEYAMQSHSIIFHTVLGTDTPENAVLRKPPEMFEVGMRLVKTDNYTVMAPPCKAPPLLPNRKSRLLLQE